MRKISTISLMTLGFCSVLSIGAGAQIINEGFEGAFPPVGWTTSGAATGVAAFAQGTVGKTGSKSAFVDIFNGASTDQGLATALTTGTTALTGFTSVSLTFQRAYEMYSNPASYTPADMFDVSVSTDGGTTWTSVFNKTGQALVTSTAPCDSVNTFVPTSSEWAMETVDLSSYAGQTIQLKFEFTNDWENDFYLDDIKVTGTGGGGGVHEVNLDAFVNVFPNPSTGPVNVDITAPGLGQTDIVVYNMVGEVVDQVSYNALSPKKAKINLEGKPNGLYFVKVKTENGSSTKKIVLNK